MVEYNELLSLINDYLMKDNVDTNEEVISVFDLYFIIKKDINKLEDKMKCLLCDMQCDEAIDDKYMNIKIRLYNSSIQIKDNEICIYFSYLNRKTKSFTYKSIKKTYGTKDIDIQNTSVNPEIITKYYDRIMEIFDIIELHRFVYELGVDKVQESFSDDLFDFSFSYNKDDVDNVDIKLREDIDLNNEFNKERLILKSLKEVVEEYKFDIMKKIAVRIDSLDEKTRRIIDRNLGTKGKKKVRK